MGAAAGHGEPHRHRRPQRSRQDHPHEPAGGCDCRATLLCRALPLPLPPPPPPPPPPALFWWGTPQSAADAAAPSGVSAGAGRLPLPPGMSRCSFWWSAAQAAGTGCRAGAVCFLACRSSITMPLTSLGCVYIRVYRRKPFSNRPPATLLPHCSFRSLNSLACFFCWRFQG